MVGGVCCIFLSVGPLVFAVSSIPCLFFHNDSLNWKKIFDLKIALHGLKRKLVFLTIY